jgi:hypothetical protein
MLNMIDELLMNIPYKQKILLIELFAHIYNNMELQVDVLVFVQLEDELDNKEMRNRILIKYQLGDIVHVHDMLLDSINR